MKSIEYKEIKYMLTVKETASILSVSVHTVYKLINEGKLSSVRISSRKTVIKAYEIERYLSEN